MKAKKTDTSQLTQNKTEPSDVPMAVKLTPEGNSANRTISRLFCLLTAGALLVGIVVLWDQNQDQQQVLEDHNARIEHGMAFSEHLQDLAIKNRVERGKLTSLLRSEMDESKKSNEALAASIRNLTLNLADLGTDLRSDMAYFRQEQDSIFATIDAMSIMTASHNERIETLTRDIAEADATEDLEALRAELTGVRQEQASAFATIEALSLQTANQDQRLEGLVVKVDDADSTEELDQVRLDLADIRQDYLSQQTEIADIDETLNETRTELLETRNASAVLAISSDQLSKKFAELEEVLTEQIFSNNEVDKPVTVETTSPAASATIPADTSFESEDQPADSDDFNLEGGPESDQGTDFEDEAFEEESEEYFDETDD